MIEGLAFIGTRATRRLAHSAMPDAPTIPEPEQRPRRVVVRPHVAAVLRRAAEKLDPVVAPRAVYR